MRVFKLDNNMFVTTKDYNDNFSTKPTNSSVHSGLKELFKFWKLKNYNLNELELGLLEAEKLDHDILEFGDRHGVFMFSLKDKKYA